MMVKPTLRKAMLALMVISLLGCSAVDNVNYADRASQAEADTSQRLIEPLLAASNTQDAPMQSVV